MLPELWAQIKSQTQRIGRQEYKLVDLGCGTGRNTLQLLYTVSQDSLQSNVRIIGVDASNGMLDVARQRIDAVIQPAEIEVKLAPFDQTVKP